MTRVISDFLLGYFGHAGAQGVKTYMDTMSASMRVDGYCRSDAGQGQTFGGTAPFLSPRALLTSAAAFAHARKQVTVPKHIYRLDCAKLATYFTILVRWDEMRSAASAMSMPWPLEHTKQEAYSEFTRAANNSAANDGAWYYSYDGPAIVPNEADTYGWQQVFNKSTNWCGSNIHAPDEPDKCIYNWPNSSSNVPCCDSCGDHPRCKCPRASLSRVGFGRSLTLLGFAGFGCCLQTGCRTSA